MLSMFAARTMRDALPVRLIPVIGGVLLMVSGVLALREAVSSKHTAGEGNREIRTGEAALLGLAVATDASVAAFSLSLMGADPLTVPFLFTGLHIALIFSGNLLGRFGVLAVGGKGVRVLPGLMLLVLGTVKLFG
jgi:putative Mn2+ efflux pump MntP